MSNTERINSLGFTAERFPAGTHMCYIFNDDAERRDAVSKLRPGGFVGFNGPCIPAG